MVEVLGVEDRTAEDRMVEVRVVKVPEEAGDKVEVKEEEETMVADQTATVVVPRKNAKPFTNHLVQRNTSRNNLANLLEIPSVKSFQLNYVDKDVLYSQDQKSAMTKISPQ